MTKVSNDDFSGLPLFQNVNKFTLRLLQEKAFKVELMKIVVYCIFLEMMIW